MATKRVANVVKAKSAIGIGLNEWAAFEPLTVVGDDSSGRIEPGGLTKNFARTH
jgi:hypothetical protein